MEAESVRELWIERGLQVHLEPCRLLDDSQGCVTVLNVLAGEAFHDGLGSRVGQERSHRRRAGTLAELCGEEHLGPRMREATRGIESLVGLNQGRVAGPAAAPRNHHVESFGWKLVPLPCHRDGFEEGGAPRSGTYPGRIAVSSRHQAHGKIGRAKIGCTGDLQGDRVVLESPGLAARMALDTRVRSPEDKGVIGLDFRVTGNPRKDHFRAAAEAREVVVTNHPNGDQKVSSRSRSIEAEGDARAEVPDDRQRVGIAAVVLTDGNARRKLADQRCS